MGFHGTSAPVREEATKLPDEEAICALFSRKCSADSRAGDKRLASPAAVSMPSVLLNYRIVDGVTLPSKVRVRTCL